MKTVELNLYSIKELSTEAQEKAHNDYLRNYEYFWGNENVATLKKFADVFPLNIKNWEYGSQYANVSWNFTGKDYIAELNGQRLATYLWNNFKKDLFKGKYYSSSFRSVPKSKEHPAGLEYTKRYSRILLEHSCVLTGYCVDEDILAPIYSFIEKPDETTFEQLIGECMSNWEKAVKNDCEYQESFECFVETCESNEYIFEENGTIR